MVVMEMLRLDRRIAAVNWGNRDARHETGQYTKFNVFCVYVCGKGVGEGVLVVLFLFLCREVVTEGNVIRKIMSNLRNLI